jgi:hypothetical protein
MILTRPRRTDAAAQLTVAPSGLSSGSPRRSPSAPPDEIGGKDGAHAPGAPANPEDARGFVSDTGVEAPAVQAGSPDAMPERVGSIDLELITPSARGAGRSRSARAARIVRDLRRADHRGPAAAR